MRILLVHGAWHGAWCWDRVVPELQAAGHDVATIDLPGHGARADERPSGLADYRDAVLEVLEPDTVLVGHSMGGAVITMVADATPERLRHLVYLAAFAPRDGESILESYGDDVDFSAFGLEITADGSAAVIPTVEAATALFYGDCDPADVEWAFKQFVPEPLVSLTDTPALPRFDAAPVARTYLLCTLDATVSPDIQRRMASRLGVEPVEIEAAHSPWLNRPADVARLILRDVQDLP